MVLDTKFDIYDWEEEEYAGYPAILRFARKWKLRPIIVECTFRITKKAKDTGHQGKLANVDTVRKILRRAFYGSSLSMVDAARSARLDEGTVSGWLNKEEPVYKEFRKAWFAVKAAAKAMVQESLFNGAINNPWAALSSLKASDPDEYQTKQTVEINKKEEISVTIKDMKVLLVEYNRSAENLKRLGIPVERIALPATPLGIDEAIGRDGKEESLACLSAVREAEIIP